MFWSVDPGDWAQPGETKIVETILKETKSGSIVLCHDMHAQTANCVGQILDGLLSKGSDFRHRFGLGSGEIMQGTKKAVRSHATVRFIIWRLKRIRVFP